VEWVSWIGKGQRRGGWAVKRSARVDDLDEGNELLGGLSGTRPQLGVDTALHTLQRHFGIRSFIGGREASRSRFVGSTTPRLRLIGLRSRHEGWRSGVMVWWTVRVSEGVGQLAVSGSLWHQRCEQSGSSPERPANTIGALESRQPPEREKSKPPSKQRHDLKRSIVRDRIFQEGREERLRLFDCVLLKNGEVPSIDPQVRHRDPAFCR